MSIKHAPSYCRFILNISLRDHDEKVKRTRNRTSRTVRGKGGRRKERERGGRGRRKKESEREIKTRETVEAREGTALLPPTPQQPRP